MSRTVIEICPKYGKGGSPQGGRAPGGDVTVLALLLYPEYRDRSAARPGMVKVWAWQGRVGICIFGADQFGNYNLLARQITADSTLPPP
jgi:hypothetical protein